MSSGAHVKRLGQMALPLRPATPLLYVMSGPSGVGKDSVLDALRVRHPHLHCVVTVTTRQPREGERDGAPYHFRSRVEFQQMLADGEFLEWATVYDNFYGTPKFELRQAAAKGNDVMVKVDIQGAASIKAAIPEAILIFLAPEALETLTARLTVRNTETDAERTRRLQTARREMEAIQQFDYVVVNGDGALQQAVDDTDAILRAERLRVAPRVFTLP